MNTTVLDSSLRSLTFQRNIFCSLAVLMSVVLVILSCFLFLKRERVIISPPFVDKEFWVDAGSVSPTYLEQMGSFLGQLILQKSAQSAGEQRSIVLRHTNATFSPMIRQKLIDEEEVLRKQNISYAFYPTDVKVDARKMEVRLTGDRMAFAGTEKVSSQKETYLLKFVYDGSRLLLNGVEAMEKAS